MVGVEEEAEGVETEDVLAVAEVEAGMIGRNISGHHLIQ